VKRSKGTRIIAVPPRPYRPRCVICGRERLSREEFAWRRRNGLVVWRCQHRRAAPSRGIAGDVGVIALVAAFALILAL
jgi:hypothetical protein